MTKTNDAITALIEGDKPYQIWARKVLPRLIRLAQAGKTITYGELAKEIGMPNPRNLNYPLGCIGKALQQLSRKWKKDVPPIQCIVIKKNTGVPGEGIDWFLEKEKYLGVTKKKFKNSPRKYRDKIIELATKQIHDYPKWRQVLKAFKLATVKPEIITAVSPKNSGSYGRGGESREHKKLKEYIAKRPQLVGLPKNSPKGKLEYDLPSGDKLDVSFCLQKKWWAVEVKSQKSKEGDIRRGLYQCVKYRAVMKATLAEKSEQKEVKAILVIKNEFPKKLFSLRNLLEVEVYDKIKR